MCWFLAGPSASWSLLLLVGKDHDDEAWTKDHEMASKPQSWSLLLLVGKDHDDEAWLKDHEMASKPQSWSLLLLDPVGKDHDEAWLKDHVIAENNGGQNNISRKNILYVYKLGQQSRNLNKYIFDVKKWQTHYRILRFSGSYGTVAVPKFKRKT